MPQLTRLTEWTVPPDEIDHLDHMSTLFYAWRADQTAMRLIEGFAGGATALASAGFTLAILDRHTHFLREQRADAVLAISGGVVAAAGARIDIYLEMGAALSGELAATFLLQVELQDRTTRAPASLPASWIEAATAGRIERPARGAPRSLTLERAGARVTVADFVQAGIERRDRREISAADCDADGFLELRRPKVTSVENFRRTGVMAAVWGVRPGFAWPALEKRGLFLRPMRQGDVLDIYEGLIEVGRKVFDWGVWTFDARDRALVSVSRNINAFFSLDNRRTEDMPADLQAHLRRLARPELLSPQPA
jgi:acyl-CoA thioesterase FadM